MAVSSPEQYRKEKDWIERVQSGDDEAFEPLLRQYWPLILTRVRRVYVPGMEFEDLEQIARIAFWNAVQTHRPERGHFAGWADRCVRCRLVTVLKVAKRPKRLRLNEAMLLTDLPESGALIPDEEPGPHELAEQAWLWGRWQQALGEFCSPVQQAAALGLARGDSYKQIAERTGYSAKSIDNALTRLKRQREQLKTFIYGDDDGKYDTR